MTLNAFGFAPAFYTWGIQLKFSRLTSNVLSVPQEPWDGRVGARKAQARTVKGCV